MEGTAIGTNVEAATISASSMTFNMDDLDQGLAADFDSNLTGLGTELGTSAYNMSEVLAVFKQEEEEEDGFQYILCAATSPAVKLSEETLTYLNQGQSYELKLNKLGNSDSCAGKVLKSVIRVLFHDKRLQYTEREQLAEWKSQRPGDRILDIDVPLSYGILQYIRSPTALNSVEVIWDPSKDSAGAFIQVHCISTEFTPKKHGGEKGVPFRVQVDTYLHTQESDTHLHSGSCQVKVFKPKGADRKHKTDRERMEKKSDRDKYQPSYEYTVLTTCQLNSTSIPSTVAPLYDAADGFNSSYEHVVTSPSSGMDAANVVTATAATPTTPVAGDLNVPITDPLLPTATSQQTQDWLSRNRFAAYRKLFQNFTGADLLRLSRVDLIQILGLADGIRLNNALQERHVRPRLAIYVCQESDQVYHAIYLENSTSEELKTKVAQLYNVGLDKISHVVRQTPAGIRVLVSDEMVQTFEDESSFSIEALKDDGRETYTVVLK
ncbi:transcription factor CP2-like [Ptychodera flava]|uniref:transcription factor CP2-like n=1 Tax=Ptychodera flava TaxID=63121 RepID=UPI00396A3561